MRRVEARNRRIANELVAEAFFFINRFHVSSLRTRLLFGSQIDVVGRARVDDEDDERCVVDIDSDSELPGIGRAFPRPTRSSWRPPIQLTKGDDPHSDHNTASGFAT